MHYEIVVDNGDRQVAGPGEQFPAPIHVTAWVDYTPLEFESIRFCISQNVTDPDLTTATFGDGSTTIDTLTGAGAAASVTVHAGTATGLVHLTITASPEGIPVKAEVTLTVA